MGKKLALVASGSSNCFGTDDRSVQANANEVGVKRTRKDTLIKMGRIDFSVLKIMRTC